MSISKNIETVVSTFQKGRKLSEQELGLEELISELNKIEPRYRSVVFEGASMGVALANSLETWKTYANATMEHQTQVHIGLGWAIAEQQLDLPSILSHIEPDLQLKVLDGYGYWHGLFRRRLTIRTQEIPKNIAIGFQSGFDQGVGRSIWYATKGDVAKVLNIINHFSEERRPNLWQGIGVAATYVGGCSGTHQDELRSVARPYSANFDDGVSHATLSMQRSLS